MYLYYNIHAMDWPWLCQSRVPHRTTLELNNFTLPRVRTASITRIQPPISLGNDSDDENRTPRQLRGPTISGGEDFEKKRDSSVRKDRCNIDSFRELIEIFCLCSDQSEVFSKGHLNATNDNIIVCPTTTIIFLLLKKIQRFFNPHLIV